MDVTLRRGTPADAEACGRIIFEAFGEIASRHNMPADVPSPEIGVEIAARVLAHPGFHAFVAETDGRIVGSLFLDERGTIAAVDPLTIAPAAQDRSIGRRLMLAALERARERGCAGVRLAQSAYHYRSLCLYSKLGFKIREPLSKMAGPPLGLRLSGYAVRPAALADLSACGALCREVHGHDRSGELRDAIEEGTARLVEHRGAVAGYATDIAFFGHAVARSNEGLKALIGAAPAFGGGFIVPTRNTELFGWALENGLRLVHQMNAMSLGLYNEPAGPYLPSVAY